MSYAPFRPTGPTLTLSATTSSVNGSWAPGIASNGPVVRVTNAGADRIFVKTGKAPVTAAKTDVVILPNASLILLKGNDDGIAVLADTATATVYATPGYGDY